MKTRNEREARKFRRYAPRLIQIGERHPEIKPYIHKYCNARKWRRVDIAIAVFFLISAFGSAIVGDLLVITIADALFALIMLAYSDINSIAEGLILNMIYVHLQKEAIMIIYMTTGKRNGKK